MNSLRFDIPFDELPGFRADAVLGHTVFDVLSPLRDLRRLRAVLLESARLVSEKEKRRCILILDRPAITEARMQDEWSGLSAVLKADILHRLALVIHHDGVLRIMFGTLSSAERDAIEPVVDHSRRPARPLLRRNSYAFYDILRVLLVHWVRRDGPVSLKSLGGQTGFSYPTIAVAMERLAPHLVRHSNRSVELRSFPHDEWFKLVAHARTVRRSTGYADRSGRPRSPEVLLERVCELRRNDIAISGVLGARHYVPSMDLIGTPRLDVVYHSQQQHDMYDWIARLDPGLKPAERDEVPQVVVHTITRPTSLFIAEESGITWADEIECLLDLHEARLEPQALDFLERITTALHP